MVKLLPDEEAEIVVALTDLHSLRDLQISGAEFAQRPLNDAQVISLMQADPSAIPPIVLTRTDLGLVIVDGYHRQEASRRRKRTEIHAIIRAFANENSLIEAAFQANLQHGLPASATTRSDYAYWLFRTYPELTQQAIAKRVGVKPSTVNMSIKRRERERKAEQKRQDLMSDWSQQEQEEQAREGAKEQRLHRLIRSYVRLSTALYEELRHLDPGERYWRLEDAIREGEKVTLARLCQDIEHYLKESLPPNLFQSLKPRAASQRTHLKKSLDNTDKS
jgi:ParB-like nuclease domain.